MILFIGRFDPPHHVTSSYTVDGSKSFDAVLEGALSRYLNST